MINWGFSIKLGWFKVLYDEKVQMLTLNSQKLMICSEDNLFSAYCIYLGKCLCLNVNLCGREENGIPPKKQSKNFIFRRYFRLLKEN